MHQREDRIRACFLSLVSRYAFQCAEAHVWVLSALGGVGPTDDRRTANSGTRPQGSLAQRRRERSAFRADCALLERLYRDRFSLQGSLPTGGGVNSVDVPAMRFGRSYSSGACVCVITRDARAGVDLEYIDNPIRLRFALDACMNVAERAVFDRLSASSRREASEWAYQCWVAKEAYAKATGEGIRMPMDQIGLQSEAGSDACGSRWHLYRVDVGADYMCALAADRELAVRLQHVAAPGDVA